MAKIPVAQPDGEIQIIPGDTRSARIYKVVKGSIDVADEDVAMVTQALSTGTVPVDLKAAEQAGYEAVKAQQATVDNQKAVADATLAGAARAAAEITKPAK